MMSWLGLAYGRAGRPRHTSSLNAGRASDAGPILTQPSPLADVEDERIVKRGTRVMWCANPRPTPIGSSTRCATAAFRARPIPFPKLAAASRRAGIRCAGLSGPPRPSPGARPRRAGRGRPRRRVLHARPRRAVALRAPGAAQRERRCLPLTYANLPLPRILFRITAIPLADRAVAVVDLG